MPPSTRITKKVILDKALEIVENNGMDAINARNLALALDCSVQPIYYQFKNMNELKSELIKYAYEFYEEYINNSKTHDLKYLSSGVAYIKFAKEKKNLFNLLFMRRRKEIIEDPTIDYVYKVAMEKTGLTLEQAKDFHFNMWIYVHGIATMIYTELVNFTDQEIESLLKNQYCALMRRYSK